MHIVLADPDRDILLCFSRLLELEGYTAATAFDAAELFRLWDESRPDLIILNAELPRLSLKKTAARITEDRVPLLVLGTGQTAPAASGDGLLSYLAYPFSPDEFLQQAAALLKKKETDEVTDHE